MGTKNITLSVQEDVLRRAKILAAQRDTSVSALVSELLEQLTGTSADYAEAWADEERAMSEGTGLHVGEIDWTRDELHTR